jgi:hypothetical protein
MHKVPLNLQRRLRCGQGRGIVRQYAIHLVFPDPQKIEFLERGWEIRLHRVAGKNYR